ncbi:hypothetical protein H7827_27410 [Streptomyces sp. JH002]|uniref:hypothetical protein n=1 Tax=Streptomyces sp. JH002 TaxID=2763259 RepID=UPI003D802988
MTFRRNPSTELRRSFTEHTADPGPLVLSAACSETEDSMPISTIAQAHQRRPMVATESLFRT